MAADTGAVAGDDDGSPDPLVTQHLRGGLETLWRAAKYARNAGIDPWNFAVEIAELHVAGLASSDLRWLIAKGYVDHASEIDPATDVDRTFISHHRFRFTSDSCFVLTRLGVEFVRIGLCEPLRAANRQETQPVDSPANGHGPANHEATTDGDNHHGDTPHWDPVRRELWVGQKLVKRFRVPAARQEIILAVFQEEGWPDRIDDPLPPQPEIDSKRQLHATIGSLNRHQKQALIHFSGDGTGTGVLWELGSPTAADG